MEFSHFCLAYHAPPTRPGRTNSSGAPTGLTRRAALEARHSELAGYDEQPLQERLQQALATRKEREATLARLRDELGWSAEIPIERTLDDLLEYWRKKTV